MEIFFAIWFCWPSLHEIYGDIFAGKLSRNFPRNWIPEGWSLEGWMADDVSNSFLLEKNCVRLTKSAKWKVLSAPMFWDNTTILLWRQPTIKVELHTLELNSMSSVLILDPFYIFAMPSTSIGKVSCQPIYC